MIQDVIDDPAMPVAWGSNKPGMQAGEECANSVCMPGRPDAFMFESRAREDAWLQARDFAVTSARAFSEAGYHKQIANRLLEPFGHISVVVTATEWDNFFDLRCHADADPTMRALAEAMRDEIRTNEESDSVDNNQWHLPYVSQKERWEAGVFHGVPFDADEQFSHLAMLSAARCARVSYLNHDGSKPDIEKDLALAKRLLDSKHMSPFEHQACSARDEGMALCLWGNFTGWDQHRKMIEAE